MRRNQVIAGAFAAATVAAIAGVTLPATAAPQAARTEAVAGIDRQVGAVNDRATVGAVSGAAAASCTTDLLFCEDFDRLPTGVAGSPAWRVEARNGTMTVERRAVKPRSDRRNKVLHVRTLDNGHAFLRVDNFAAPGNRVFGRMRLRVDAFPTAPDWAHFTLVEATGTGSTEVVRPIGGQYVPTLGKSLWGIGADGGPTGDWTNWRESAPIIEDAWICVEWQLDGTGNQVAAWFNGVPNPELTASTDMHGGNQVPFILPTVNTVKIGWQLYQGGTTPGQFDLWIDDIALSTQRVGC